MNHFLNLFLDDNVVQNLGAKFNFNSSNRNMTISSEILKEGQIKISSSKFFRFINNYLHLQFS